MEFKDLFKDSSNEIIEHNKELLEEHDLLNVMGSPKRIFLEFLKTKNLNISSDELTEELIEEFEDSADSVNIKLAKIQRHKELIFKQRKVWITICIDGKWTGTDLLLDYDGVTIQINDEKILYSDMIDIEIDEGGWSKNKFTIITSDEEYSFEINEDNSIPLKEILEDNMDNSKSNEIDYLLELYDLYEEGKITPEEFEMRKAIIYSDDVYCTNCGEKLDSDAEFCSNCGHHV